MRTLLCRGPLQPNESLPSLIRRLAILNGYDPPGIINGLDRKGLRDRHYILPTESTIVERLATLTRIESSQLYTATAHRFADILTPPETPVGEIELGGISMPCLPQSIANKQLRPETAAQFCPHCLRQAAYHRLAWLPVVISACTEHRRLLLDRCPSCHKPVSIRSVVDGVCLRCKADLTEAQAEIVEPDALLSQQIIQHWLGIGSPPENWRGIPDQPPQVQFRVLDGLRLSLMSHTSAQQQFQRLAECPRFRKGQKLTPSQSLALYTTALEALQDWPTGFHSFLNKFSNAGAGNSLFHRFGFLYTQWLQYRWQSPAYHFVQQAFDDYVTQHFAHSTTLHRAERYQKQTAQQVIRRYLTLTQASKQLGVSKNVLLDLVEIKVLTAEAGPGVDGSQQWLINRVSLLYVLEQLRDITTDPTPNHTIGLTKAARLMATIGLNVAGVVDLLLKGHLSGAWNNTDLGGLRFCEQDILAGIVAEKRNNGWLNRAEVATRMGVKVTVVSKWMRTGLLAPVETHVNAQYFDQTAIEHFVQGHVFSDEAAEILGVGLDVVQKWARKGRLKPVTGGGDSCSHRYLFRRVEVERLRPENRLTGSQLAKQLGLSRSQLWQGIKQGKLKPVSGSGIDGCKYYLFLNSDLCHSDRIK